MNEQAPPSLLVIVPRTAAEACRRLQQTLDGAGIRVVIDRRSTERRARFDARQSEPQATDRRTRGDRDAALAAGRWIVVAAETERVSLFDPDARAILFLYCSQHPVPCERCQETYRLRWLVRTERQLACPRCGDDLSRIVVAHALRCPNWVSRGTRSARPAAAIVASASSARAAS